MIEKIIEIKNVGHFTDFRNTSPQNWNGSFRKVNIIYAPNGSGKTTLSTIFKSLAQNNPDLLKWKQTFGTSNQEHIVLRDSNSHTNITFNNNVWSNSITEIEVFDINYIEEYLFAGSFARKQNKTNLFKLLLGEEGENLKKNLKPFRKKVINLEAEYKRIKKTGTSKQKRQKHEELIQKQQELKTKENEFKSLYEPIFETHIEIINRYLRHFSNYIRLKKFKWDSSSKTDIFRLLPVFDVYHEEVTFTSITPGKDEKTARYSLSEGDKSTIALCFFLGRLEINFNPNRIVVFDDPLSSFDFSRRNSTITQLAKIAQNSSQFFLLSHDMHFIYDFSKKVDFLDSINLKIENNGNSSILCFHNLLDEYLTGTHKDINVLLEYKQNPNVSDEKRREVIRCIRPMLASGENNLHESGGINQKKSKEKSHYQF